MNVFFSRKLSDTAEVRRVEILFASLPSAIASVLIGVFLCSLVLFGAIELTVLKAWVVYMLSVLGLRVGIWYMFSKADRHSEGIYRWEWLFAAGAFCTGVGWGALFGPLFPSHSHQDAQIFIALMVVITAFTGSVFVALSNITFWLFIIPTLAPALAAYVSGFGHAAQWPAIAAASCIAVFIIVQRTLYLTGVSRLQRSTDDEFLLAEQQAIFESSPLGIAVINNWKILKCNSRLAELLGRRIQDITGSPIGVHFCSDAEAGQFLAESAQAFSKNHLAQGMYRLHRANGSEFWAEFSGRKMSGAVANSVWMIADVTLRVANERKAQLGE